MIVAGAIVAGVSTWVAAPLMKVGRRRTLDPADTALLKTIDGVIAITVQDPATKTRELLLQLGGIRRGLFPDAPPYIRPVEET